MLQAPKALAEALAAFKDAVRLLPAAVLAAGLANGSLWTLLCGGAPVWLQGLCALPALALALPLLKRAHLLSFAAATALGFASAQINAYVPESDCSRLISRANCGAIVEAQVADESCCGEELPWLPNPSYVKMKALRLKFTEGGEWMKASGLFAAKLPKEAPKLEYGAKLRLEGAFLELERPASEGSFDFKGYLERRGMRRVYEVASLEAMEGGSGFMHALFEFRNAALLKICEGIRDDGAKRLTAALAFGCQQGVDWESRRDFIRSGTIHILSVSGLHVAMVAAILALALRFLPFRPRHLAVPALTLLYALMTGMQAPSFRAFAMLATWCVLRSLLLCAPALNSVALAASLLLLWNPGQMLDAGFQYSFITVAFLIGSANFVADWRSKALERRRWIPPQFQSAPERALLKCWEWGAVAVAGCVVAWLASCGPTLLYQGLNIPFSVPANLALIPITWCVFALFAAEAALFWLPGFTSLCGCLQEGLLWAMDFVCGLFADAGCGAAPMPPAWSVGVFLALFAALLAFRARKALLASAAGMALILGAWSLRSGFKEPELAVLHGGESQEPALAISDPRTGLAIVVNAPDFDAARQITAQLASRGISSAELFLACSAGKAHCGGGPWLLSFMDVKSLAIPKFASSAISAGKCVAAAASSGAAVKTVLSRRGESVFESAQMKSKVKRGFWRFECSAPGLNIVAVMDEKEPGVRTLSVADADGRPLGSMTLENSVTRALHVIPLQRRP